jgi:sporulation protein YlmC with PRC-barrel domain
VVLLCSADLLYHSGQEHNPAGELAIRRGARVEAVDGHAGRVDEFLINPENDHITHLVMREGHLWGQKDVTIPMSQIDRFADNTVYLKLNKQEIEELLTIPVQHNRVISDKTMM